MTVPSVPVGTPQSSASACPYCMWSLAQSSSGPDAQIQACTSCGTRYHADCFAENGGCAVFGCPAWTARQMGLPGVMPPAPQVVIHASPPQTVAAWEAVQPRQIFCEQCGVMISSDDSFCGSCGSSVYRGAP